MFSYCSDSEEDSIIFHKQNGSYYKKFYKSSFIWPKSFICCRTLYSELNFISQYTHKPSKILCLICSASPFWLIHQSSNGGKLCTVLRWHEVEFSLQKKHVSAFQAPMIEKSDYEEDLLITMASGVFIFYLLSLCFFEFKCCLQVPDDINFFEQISQYTQTCEDCFEVLSSSNSIYYIYLYVSQNRSKRVEEGQLIFFQCYSGDVLIYNAICSQVLGRTKLRSQHIDSLSFSCSMGYWNRVYENIIIQVQICMNQKKNYCVLKFMKNLISGFIQQSMFNKQTLCELSNKIYEFIAQFAIMSYIIALMIIIQHYKSNLIAFAKNKMIFVTYQDQTGTPKTQRINITQCTTTTQLLQKISLQLKIKKQWMVAKLKNDLIALRLVDNWPLHKYPIKNGSRINIQLLKDVSDKFSPYHQPAQLKKIDQELQEQQLQLESEYLSSLSDNHYLQQFSDLGWGKYLELNLSHFLSAIREKSLDKAAEMLKVQPQIRDEKHLQKMIYKKNKYLLDELGQCGKSALHWAIHQKDLDMVQFLLIKSCNPNTVSLDQYTPLQLAISVKQPTIFQTLIAHPKIEMNKLTNKGTALHVAILSKQISYIQKLLACGVDTQIPDDNGKTAQNLISQLKLKVVGLDRDYKIRQQIPYISRGKIYKITSFSYRHKQKLLLINPFANQLIVYDQEKSIQNSVMINQIKSAFRLMHRTWLMKKQYTYFQIQTKDNTKLLLATKNKEITDKWVDVIHKAHAFASLKYKINVKVEQQLIQAIDDQKNQINLHKRKHNTKPIQSKPKISLFDLKPAQQYDQNEDKQLEEHSEKQTHPSKSEGISDKLTSSALAQSESDSSIEEAVDLRQSQILGSVIDTNKFLTPPRKASDNYSVDSFCHSFRLSTIDTRQPLNVSFMDFQILRQLGNGSFGKVFLARYEKTQQLYALKVLNKKKLMVKKQLKYAVGEANILKKVNNPFVIKLHYSFQTPNNLYMALDYCPHGDLAQILCDQVRLSEKACKFYVAQLILSIEYLHKNKIIYRDLKPENILIGKDGFIRLADFGLSKQNNFSMSFCGSPAYLSPQMLEKKGVGFQADIYGIGCVLYQMLVGQPPYFDDDLDTLFENIRIGKLKFPSFLSKAAKSLINALLQRNIDKRLGVKNFDEIKKHDFFSNFKWEKLMKMQMNLPVQLLTRFTESTQVNLQVITEHGFSDCDYDSKNTMINRIKGFTFIRDLPTE